GRVVVAAAPDQMAAVLDGAAAAGVPTSRIGLATGDRLVVKDLLDVAVADLTSSWHDHLPAALGHGTTQG
ncbi:MAG: hypothetical protein H0W25_09340, partial [Acidimicrobiia bacterium]|nr:hypothetical protein [Acidimicrobiia bacterium]